MLEIISNNFFPLISYFLMLSTDGLILNVSILKASNKKFSEAKINIHGTYF